MVAAISFKIDELREYAVAAGLSLNFVVKEAFMFELMDLMAGAGFVLKGGTAINKGFLQGHQRFSEDLDYDTDHTAEQVRRIIASLGWDIKKEFYTKSSIGFMMHYRYEGINDVVRIDVSFGIKGAAERIRLASDFVPASKIVETYVFKELNRQKEAAFEARLEWKDLYDLYWLHSLYPSKFSITDRSGFVRALSTINVPKTANAYIPVQKRPNWNAVIEELKFAASR